MIIIFNKMFHFVVTQTISFIILYIFAVHQIKYTGISQTFNIIPNYIQYLYIIYIAYYIIRFVYMVYKLN